MEMLTSPLPSQMCTFDFISLINLVNADVSKDALFSSAVFAKIDEQCNNIKQITIIDTIAKLALIGTLQSIAKINHKYNEQVEWLIAKLSERFTKKK